MTRGLAILLAVVVLAVLAAAAWLRDGGETVRRTIGGTYGRDGRLTFYLGKTHVPCPAQEDTTAVILAMGQSNIGNSGERRVSSRHRGAVLNYAAGECTLAASPLLGANSEEGEFLTLLADRLIDDGSYKAVILAPFSVGNTTIGRWRQGGDVNAALLPFLQDLSSRYWVTQALWHQGESDYIEKTSTADYVVAFESLAATLLEKGVRAPLFIAVSTRCGDSWSADNPIARAQRGLAERSDIHLGADADALLTEADRRDGCHLSASGQEKIAEAYARSIAKVRNGGR
ncbi:MAG: hypothetical protein JOY81_00970 [Alphaproteobacteria bacterium]|nr:hypothetical protein [Alphaproteobacteria bacterium]